MRYSKPFLTFEEQAEKLLGRGLEGDKDLLVNHLQSVSYYRLSGYWYPFRKNDPANPRLKLEEFLSGATIDRVWERYVFDRKLRLQVMDALERIEIDVRTQLAYLHANEHGAFGYADAPASLPRLDLQSRTRLLNDLRKQLRDSREDFIDHFRTKYGQHHNDLPIWVACEIMTFGNLLTFYRGCDSKTQKHLAARYGIQDVVCESWLKTFNTIGNTCAHHARLWNRILGVKPMIPRKDGRWQVHPGKGAASIPNDRVFAVLAICRHCMEIISPGNEWTDRLKELIAESPDIPVSSMGFIPKWDEHPLWVT